MKEKINNIELSSILFLIMFSSTLGIAPYITIKLSGIDSYISTILGAIIGLIPVLIFIYIFNYQIDKPIYQKTKIIFGKNNRNYHKYNSPNNIFYLSNNNPIQYK